MKETFLKTVMEGAGIGRKKAEYLWQIGVRLPAEQHQGEPVALPERRDENQWDDFRRGSAHGFNACLVTIAKLGPLYTHPDLVTVKADRDAYAQNAIDLRAQLEIITKNRDELCRAQHRTADEREQAHAQLAELGALLRQCGNPVRAQISRLEDEARRSDHPKLYRDEVERLSVILRQMDALSANAELSAPKCTYCGDTGQIMVGRSGDANDGNAPIMEPCEDCERGAPVERAAFEADWAARHGVVTDVGARNSFYRLQPLGRYRWPDVQNGWDAWQARAALERKP